jgi:hypothetical protein
MSRIPAVEVQWTPVGTQTPVKPHGALSRPIYHYLEFGQADSNLGVLVPSEQDSLNLLDSVSKWGLPFMTNVKKPEVP